MFDFFIRFFSQWLGAKKLEFKIAKPGLSHASNHTGIILYNATPGVGVFL